MIIYALSAEGQGSSVISVPPEGSRSIRAGVGLSECSHSGDSLRVYPRNILSRAPAIQRRQQKQFQDKTVVGDGCFKIHAVFVNLFRQFVRKDFPSHFRPPPESFPVGEK